MNTTVCNLINDLNMSVHKRRMGRHECVKIDIAGIVHHLIPLSRINYKLFYKCT